MWADNKALRVVGGEEIAAALGVRVVALESRLPPDSICQVSWLASGLMQRQCGAYHTGEIRCEPGIDKLAPAPSMPHAIVSGHGFGNKAVGLRGKVDPFRLVQQCAGIGKPGNHQA